MNPPRAAWDVASGPSHQVRSELDTYYAICAEVSRVAYNVLRRRRCADAEDLAQDVAFEALTHLERDPQYFDTRPLHGWAKQAALYTASRWNERQDNAASANAAFAAEQDAEEHEHTNSEISFSRSELGARLARAMALLDARHRAVLLAVCRDGQTYEQAGEALGLSVNTVDRYLHRARTVLMRELETNLNPDEQ